MKIGYACQCLSNTMPSFRTCIKKFASEENLLSIITHNLKVLDEILDYNHEHGIQLFRLSSDLIPFGSSPINTVAWRSIFASSFLALGEKAKAYHMRLTMHPGQYTILNTPDENVWQRSVLDLRYHCDILNLMGMDTTNKLILHVGGIYGNKEEAIKRFLSSFPKLDEDIQARLILENDDRYYTLQDVWSLANQLHIPIVFDNLHHALLPSFPKLSLLEVMQMVQKSWKKQDGRMKIHYSQQDPDRRKGAHAHYLDPIAFVSFCEDIKWMDIDIMLEVKSKNLAALEALDLLYPKHFCAIKTWKHYRFLVLRHSISIFTKLEQDVSHMDAYTFYQWIHTACSMMEEQGAICYRLMLQEWAPRLQEEQKVKLTRAIMRYQEHKLSEQGVKQAFLTVSKSIKEEDDYLFL